MEITAGLSLLLLLFGALRAKRRWQGMKDMKQFSKFSFVREISKSARNAGIIVTALEMAFMLGLLLLCIKMSSLHPEYTLTMIIVLALLCTESFIFILRLAKGGSAFRIGFNDEVLAYFNREIHLFYYTGLRRVELVDKSINFQYRDELNLLFPVDLIKKEDRKAFRDALIETLTPRNVYIDDAFRTLE